MANWLRSPSGFMSDLEGSGETTLNVNSKGSYSEVIASTPHDTTGVTVFIGGGGTADRSCLYDIAVGAASSEQVIIENLLTSDTNEIYRARHPGAYFPIAIPAGTRVSARGQRSGGSSTEWIRVLFHYGDAWASSSFGLCHTMGANTADSGGTTLTGGSGAFGSYAQITASTEFDCEALLFSLGSRGVSQSQTDGGALEIVVGAAASETLIYKGEWYHHSLGEHLGPKQVYLPSVHIPAGSRISARIFSNYSQSKDIVLYGFC